MKKDYTMIQKREKKAENFSFWYQFLSPLLWFGSCILSIALYDVGKEYGYLGKIFGYLCGILLFNLIVWLMKKIFNKKFSEYRYLLAPRDKSRFFTFLSMIFMIIVLGSGR